MKLLKITSLLCFATVAIADEVRLVDGTIIKDCTIDVENDKEITISVPISKTIKDTKTIARDQVLLIKKSTKDEKDYSALKSKYSELDNLPLEDLKKGEQDLDEFIKNNAQSKKIDEAKGLLGKIKEMVALKEKAQTETQDKEEKSKPSEKDVKRFSYDIEANKVLDDFKARIKKRETIRAMISFDQLAQNYSASSAYAESREVVAKVLPQLVKNLGQMSKNAEEKSKKDRKSESDKTLELQSVARKTNLTPEQKAAAQEKLDNWRQELARREEMRNAQRTKFREEVAKLKDKKIRWYNPIPEIPMSIRDLESIAQADLKRVERELKDAKYDHAGKGSLGIKTAWEALDAGELDKATEALADVKAARVGRDYWDALDVEIRAAKAAEADKKRAEREVERTKLLEERRKKEDERRKEAIKSLEEKQKERTGGKDKDKK